MTFAFSYKNIVAGLYFLENQISRRNFYPVKQKTLALIFTTFNINFQARNIFAIHLSWHKLVLSV